MKLHEMKYNEGARSSIKQDLTSSVLVVVRVLAKVRLLVRATRVKTQDLVVALLSVSKVDKHLYSREFLREDSLTSLELNTQL